MPTLSFAADIRPLFRRSDIETMKPIGLDLSSYEEVKSNAASILGRLEAGDMPCDGGWAAASKRKFKSWIAEGMPA
jgi:hypothetical protein